MLPRGLPNPAIAHGRRTAPSERKSPGRTQLQGFTLGYLPLPLREELHRLLRYSPIQNCCSISVLLPFDDILDPEFTHCCV